jgi:peptide/nickel transport system permease protein
VRVGRLLLKRLLLSLATLWLLSIIVFISGRLLPGDVGRSILGPLADAQAVANLDHQLGTDRPALIQYLEWLRHLATGNLGISYALNRPVAPMLGQALVNSLKLGGVAFAIVVPLSLLGGIWAALHAGRWIDRVITLAGLSFSIVPEFVSSIVLILLFGVWLQWLPITATWPEGAGVLTQLRYLILPSLPLSFVFFGYMARMARAGMVEALAADYTRTAILKGLPMATVIRRHVMRNALLPTVTVMATQSGYLIGGLVVVETLFRYQGLGGLILAAAKAKDVPMLEAGILSIGIVYTLATLLADLVVTLLNPRLRVAAA